MLDSLGADQGIGDLAHGARLTAHDQDLETIVVVEVHVKSGENGTVVVVLQVGQLLIEQADMMVVDQRDGADDARLGT